MTPARIRSVRLPNEPYLQSNGYKPAPLDLSAIELTPKMEELVTVSSKHFFFSFFRKTFFVTTTAFDKNRFVLAEKKEIFYRNFFIGGGQLSNVASTVGQRALLCVQLGRSFVMTEQK